MKGIRNGFLGIIGFFAMLAVVLCASPGDAGVDVNINIGLPVVVVAGPPEMIVIPQTMVYFAPDVEAQLFFSAGFWWTPHRGRWFRSRAYNGPWVRMAPRYVPAEFGRLPRDYRRTYVRDRRIPYGQLNKHWEHRKWERRERRGEWKGWKEDRRQDRRQDRREDRRENRGRGPR
jgi:hypothetical protein